MAKAGGYVLRLTHERRDVFHHAVDEYGRFAEAVPLFGHSRNAPLVCFIVDPSGRVTHIGRGRRGVNAGTQQSSLVRMQRLWQRMMRQRPCSGRLS